MNPEEMRKLAQDALALAEMAELDPLGDGLVGLKLQFDHCADEYKAACAERDALREANRKAEAALRKAGGGKE